MDKLKALFHVNESSRWDAALGNVANLIKNVGEGNAEISVLANGASVCAYKDSEMIETMRNLSASGAKFYACRNSLQKMAAEGLCIIEEDSLPPFVTLVPAGVTELIKFQHKGYAYIKP